MGNPYKNIRPVEKPQSKKRLIIIIEILLLAAVVAAIIVFVRAGSTNEADNQPGEATGQDAQEPPAEVPRAEQTATYTVRYDVTWGPKTHPQTLPPGPHVSPIVIVAHNNEDALFAPDEPATDGIEMMAETGATGVLADEISKNDSILSSATGTRVDAPGSISLEIEFDQEHSLLSAVSMLAPSPDWFVAVDNVDLFEDGQWLERIELEMRPYDAGTDSGATFTAADSDTTPAETIGPPVDSQFISAAAENIFATLTIMRN